jgi:hypothetical protein
MKKGSEYFTHIAIYVPEYLAASHILVLSIIPQPIIAAYKVKLGKSFDESFGLFLAGLWIKRLLDITLQLYPIYPDAGRGLYCRL